MKFVRTIAALIFELMIVLGILALARLCYVLFQIEIWKAYSIQDFIDIIMVKGSK